MPSAASSAPPTPCPFIPSVSSNPCIAGGVQVGSNGSGGGSPGIVLGNGSGTNPSTGNVIWDANPSGFDSGWVAVQIVASAGGGANGVTCTVTQPNGSTTTVNYSGVNYGTINDVQLQAAVSASNMTITFRSVVVQYYKNGNLTDTVSLPDECAPIADTTGAGAPPSASQVSRLSPHTAGNTKVVITFLVRMQTPQSTLPAPTAIIGRFFIFANNCSTNP